jgi:hypothetical protein
MRDNFIFYRSFYEAIKDLPRDIQGDVYTAIMEYSLNGITTENLKPVARSIFILMKPVLDANNQRYENGKKGGRRAKTETKDKPDKNQTETKDKPNKEEDVDNDNDLPPLPPTGGSESGSDKETWKTDFEVYKSELRDAFREISKNADWIRQQERLNPNIDIMLSIEKACVNYWATEAGWKKKKGSKIKNIDWKATFGNAISLNKVYKQENYANKEQTSSVIDI